MKKIIIALVAIMAIAGAIYYTTTQQPTPVGEDIILPPSDTIEPEPEPELEPAPTIEPEFTETPEAFVGEPSGLPSDSTDQSPAAVETVTPSTTTTTPDTNSTTPTVTTPTVTTPTVTEIPSTSSSNGGLAGFEDWNPGNQTEEELAQSRENSDNGDFSIKLQ